MKPELVEKKLHYGRLAEELERCEAYQEIQKRSVEKEAQSLKEAMESKTIGDLRYMAGFIEGLKFSKKLTDQWSQEAKNLRK